MHSKKHLSFTALRQAFSSLLYKIEDTRQKNKTEYTLHDVVMSGFACMYMQCKSLLFFQRKLAKRHSGRNNLQTLLGYSRSLKIQRSEKALMPLIVMNSRQSLKLF